MTSKYKVISLYVTNEQYSVIKSLFPQKMSFIFRHFLDMLLEEKINHPIDELKNLSEEDMASIFKYKEEMKKSEECSISREKMREIFYSYLDQNEIPKKYAYNSAVGGRRKMRKLCKEYLNLFRSEGFILSNRVADQFITDYLNRVESLGLDDDAWAAAYKDNPNEQKWMNHL